jgi:hypothetical protein
MALLGREDSAGPPIESEAFLEWLAQRQYDGALPPGRWMINHWRKQEGKPPFRGPLLRWLAARRARRA